MDRPLAGLRILVTRAAGQAGSLSAALAERGGEPIRFPVIATADPESWGPLDQAIDRLEQYRWLVLTSPTGARQFTGRLAALRRSAPAGLRVVAVGPATAKELAAGGVDVELMPQESRGAALSTAMAPHLAPGDRVLMARGNLAGAGPAEALRALGAVVDEVEAYRTIFAGGDAGPLRQALADGGIHYVTFTSGSTVENLLVALGGAQLLHGVRIAVLGPETEAVARRHGLTVHAVAVEQSVQGLVRAIIEDHLEEREVSHTAMAYPTIRPRRLRRTETVRRMVRETVLTRNDLILPLFVAPGKGVRREISAMPGNYHWSADTILHEMEAMLELGLQSTILFGLPEAKDEVGTGAYHEQGVVQQAIRAIKARFPEMHVITDVCLCEYTSHGHCGIICGDTVDNDPTLELLAKTALSHAQAGADMVAPSDMMDGRVAAIRQALDRDGFTGVPIMAYSAKYASAYYGPFRVAADSAPAFGDRRAYQMDPGNAREALREVELDVLEGADIVMVKPALAYLDIIYRVREAFDLPVACYNVSGEFAMVKAAAAQGWIDERRTVMETMLGFKRAGADLILTYHAKDVAHWLNEER